MLQNTLIKPSFKRKLLPFIILPILFLSVFPQKGYAEGISLRVNPSVLQIRTEAPADIHAPFLIQNQNNESVKLRIGYKLFDRSKSQEGKVVFLDNPAASSPIFDAIQITDTDNTPINSLDLGPKQQKQLELHVVLPDNQPSADYYFSLIFLNDLPQQSDQTTSKADKKDQHTLSTVQGGIGANVLLAVGVPETPQGYIQQFTTPLYLQSGPVPFTIKVKNQGIHFINPHGVIFIQNIFGQTVGKVTIPSSTVLAGTTRSLLDEGQITSSDPINPTAYWKEQFLLGFYTATLKLSMGDSGPAYSQTIRFVAFPLNLLIGLIISILAIATIYVKVKRKFS